MSEVGIDSDLQALRRISPMPDDNVLEDHPETVDLYDEIVESLMRKIAETSTSRLKEEIVDVVMHSFGPGDGFETYWSAIHLIEKLRSDETYERIRTAILHGQQGTKRWGCLLLGRRRDIRDLPVLISCLQDPDSRVVVQALHSIEMLRQVHPIPQAIPAVQDLLDSPLPAISRVAENVLRSLTA